MYTDYTVDDVIEAAASLVQDISNIFGEVKGRCDALESLYLGSIDKGSKDGLLQMTETFIGSEYNKQEVFVSNLNEKKTDIENLESTVFKLKKLKSKREMECSNLDQKVSAFRDKIQSVLEEKENISNKRDEILTYKVLTNVDFVYTTKKVTGLVMKQDPKPFILNPQELSQEEITKKLWNLILSK